MPYKPSLYSGISGHRIGPSVGAIVPASILSGFVGTLLVTLMLVLQEMIVGELRLGSLWDALSAVLLTGSMVGVGSIGGAFFVGFYLLFFGLPVAALLGERIEGTVGLVAALVTGLIATSTASLWIWNISVATAKGEAWQPVFMILAFSLPATFIYRRQVMAMREEVF